MLLQPALELVDPVARVHGLEEGAAAHDRRVEVPVERNLLLEVVGHVAGAPAEFDDVDEGPAGVEHPLDVAEIHALVYHVRQSDLARLPGAGRDVEETVVESVRGGHTAPLASPGPRPGR